MKEVVAENREKMLAVAEELKSESWSVTWTNTAEFAKVLENMFGITEFPRIVVQKKAGDQKHYIYEGGEEKTDFSKEAILKFVKAVEAGEVKPHLKSEPVPESNDGPVKVAVGTTMEEVFES